MRQISLFLSLFVCAAIIFSCNTITQKKFEFFYYPAKNVYYDVANNFYLYSLNGGKTWDSLNAATSKEPQTLGSKQIIYSTSAEIWTDNEKHIAQYNGHVININADSILSQSNLAEERKIRKAKTISTTSPNKQPEKKPGFFKRLFGKKN